MPFSIYEFRANGKVKAMFYLETFCHYFPNFTSDFIKILGSICPQRFIEWLWVSCKWVRWKPILTQGLKWISICTSDLSEVPNKRSERNAIECLRFSWKSSQKRSHCSWGHYQYSCGVKTIIFRKYRTPYPSQWLHNWVHHLHSCYRRFKSFEATVISDIHKDN
jgi:hypothetical protein